MSAGIGSVSSVGSRPTTGDSSTTAVPFRLVVPFRATRRGAVTHGVAVCQRCRKVIGPIERRRSRVGTHGEDFYVHEHPISAVVFVESNSGNRSYYFMGEKISDDATSWAVWIGTRAWTLERKNIDDVIETIRGNLQEVDE